MSLDQVVQLDGEERDIEQLILQLDHEDPLVAYAAKERVLRFMGASNEPSTKWIRLLLTTSGQEEWRPSSGYRFQALRCLLDRVHETDSEADATETVLEGILSHLELVQKITLDAFGATGRERCLEPTVCFEALGFLSCMLKHVMTLSSANEGKLLRKLDRLMHTVADLLCSLDFNDLPTFLSCTILNFMGDYQDLLERQAADSGVQEHQLRKRSWTECCVKLLLQSSCSPVVLRLFKSEESSDTSCAQSFIAVHSRYPLLQHWIRFSSNLLVSALSSDLSVLSEPITFRSEDLPDRMQLLEVVSEQDDAMVDTLNSLLQSSMLVDAIKTRSHHKVIAPLVRYLNEQLDPDLLFAGAVAKFGDDHLVLLDLLISSETTMLEYLMRYLRHLVSAWPSSSVILKSHDRLEHNMDVFIRLRLEIEKLNAAGIFPYNPSPLLRRLHEIERLYEKIGHGLDEG